MQKAVTVADFVASMLALPTSNARTREESGKNQKSVAVSATLSASASTASAAVPLQQTIHKKMTAKKESRTREDWKLQMNFGPTAAVVVSGCNCK